MRSLLPTCSSTIILIRICSNWQKIGPDLALPRKRGILCSSCSLELHLGRTQKGAIRSTSTHFAEIVGSRIPVHLIVKFVENAMTGGSGIVRFVTFARTAYHYHAKGVEAFQNPMRTRIGIWNEYEVDTSPCSYRNFRGETPLHMAATEGNKDAVQYLLDAKSDIAAKAGHLDILKILMRAGAEFLDQQTALHLAAAILMGCF